MVMVASEKTRVQMYQAYVVLCWNSPPIIFSKRPRSLFAGEVPTPPPAIDANGIHIIKKCNSLCGPNAPDFVGVSHDEVLESSQTTTT